MSVYGRKRLAWKGETAEGIWIFREKGSWAAAEHASDCHRAVERYHWSDIIRRDHGCNQSLYSWFFYAINRLVRALSYLQKKGDFYHGICTCYVCHILGADTASCGNRSCVDHERGVFVAVCWNSGWRSVLFMIQF